MERKAESLLEEWQERLGLLDWAITLRINCQPEEMEEQNVCGETSWAQSIKAATIRIISEEVHGTDRILNYDFEQTLVHELLHLKFGILDNQNKTYESIVTYEVIHELIDDLARALVMAKRGETKRHINGKRVRDSKREKEDLADAKSLYDNGVNPCAHNLYIEHKPSKDIIGKLTKNIELQGELIQEHIPTPEHPCEIENKILEGK